jgi:hypothetical protein
MAINALGFDSRAGHPAASVAIDPVTLALTIGGAIPFMVAWLLARGQHSENHTHIRTVVP